MEEIMANVFAFLADGSEEVESLAVLDVLVRAGIEVKLISITGNKEVVTSHNVHIVTDELFEEADCKSADVLFIPGGLPGTTNMMAHEGLCKALTEAAEDGRRVAAICAAPSVLGQLGLLKGKKATCYPGFEDKLTGAEYTRTGVVTDGNITTARGLGYGLDLGLELVALLDSKEKAAQIKAAIQYDQF